VVCRNSSVLKMEIKSIRKKIKKLVTTFKEQKYYYVSKLLECLVLEFLELILDVLKIDF